jgi:hypothetical protein
MVDVAHRLAVDANGVFIVCCTLLATTTARSNPSMRASSDCCRLIGAISACRPGARPGELPRQQPDNADQDD